MSDKINKLLKIKLKKRIFIYLVLAVLCVWYGITVASQGYGTVFFAIWIFIAFFLIICSIAAQREWWKKLPKWVKIVTIAVFTTCICIFVGVEALIYSHVNDKGEDNLDYIIVLGAKVNKSGPSSILAARLNVAIRYLENNEDTLVIVSGGQGYNEPFSEAEGMRDYLVEKGISEERIILEPNSLNTNENIKNSMEIIGNNDAKVGIATSNFHVYRACKIAKKQGLNNVSGIAGNVVPFYMPQNMFREFFGVVKDTLQGNMCMEIID